MTEQICEVIITADDEDWLVNFTRSLVKDRLVACGQHVAPVRSIYRWGEMINDEREVRVALHTRVSLVEHVIERTRQEHPYDVPCVLAFGVEAGNSDYIKWVMAETSDPGGDHRA